MSRVLKFRIWDIYKRTFIPDDVWAIVNANKDNYFGVMIKNWEDYLTGEYFYEHTAKLSQFIGLFDKNGKGIYEGDIVKWGHLCESSRENPPRIALVKINPDIQFDAKNIGHVFHYAKFAYQETHKYLEIIGNIYETPSILEGQH